MKKLILTLFLLVAVLSPNIARAATDEEPEYGDWFLYVFHLTYNKNVIGETQHYDISTGDASPFPTGHWSIAILDSQDAVRYTQTIDPTALVDRGGTLSVPYHNSGTTAIFVDPAGNRALSIDLEGSRVCDDDGTCESDYGEDSHTCPGDCGSVVVASPQIQIAAISQYVPASRRVGSFLIRLGFAGAGIMLIIGVTQMLDSRRRP